MLLRALSSTIYLYVSKGNVWCKKNPTKIQLKKRLQWNSHKLISLTANRATQSHTNTLQACVGPSLSLAQQIWLCIHSLGAFTVQQWADSHHPWHDCVTVKKKKVKKSRMKDSFKQLIFYLFSYLDRENVSPCVLKMKYLTFNQFLHTVWWL